MLYKIYAIDLRNIEVKLIDTKRKIFGTFKKTMLHQIMSYRVTLNRGVTVLLLVKKMKN